MQSAARVGGEIGMDLQRLHAEVPGLKASKTGESLILNVDGAALFDGRQGALNADGRRALASIARFMDEHPRQAVMVSGFEAGQADVVRQTLAQYAKRRVNLQFPEPGTAGASAGR
jgi:hypothetical protein